MLIGTYVVLQSAERSTYDFGCNLIVASSKDETFFATKIFLNI